MADTPVVQVYHNGYRNLVIGLTLVSDGSGLTAFKVYDATSATYAVNKGGQLFTPGIHSKLVGLDFDVQDMKAKLSWEASSNVPFFAFGASPEDFNWKSFGGLWPPVVAGATGSILVNTIDPMPNSTLSLILYLRKDVPSS